MDIKGEIDRIESSIDVHTIAISEVEADKIVLKLAHFEYFQYTKLTVMINRMRLKCKTYVEKAMYIPLYKDVYRSARKMYRKTLLNIKAGNLKIRHCGIEENILNAAKQWFPNIADLGFKETCIKLVSDSIVDKISDIAEELYVLENHENDYINTYSTYIGPESVMRYRNDRVYYKDVSFIPTDSHSYSVSYNEMTAVGTKNAILDIVAYLNGMPYFYFTDNPEFNSKISDLYDRFELIDIIKLRKKNYFSSASDESKPISLQLPILRTSAKRRIIEIPESEHEKVFEIYHASLKQFEPMPRCVFLYRVFEYGAKYHYQSLMHPSSYDPRDAIEHYVSKVFEHRYAPMYYITHGRIRLDLEAVKVIRKSICINYLTKLKREANSILKEWSEHSFLRTKRIGEIIYGTGRNASAHASGGRSDARYDYGLNYQHINNVNIILELIARYIVEELNPGIVGLVERNKAKYIKQSFLGV